MRVEVSGTSHGRGISVVLSGVPSDLELDLQQVQTALDARRPGRPGTSPRQESDLVELVDRSDEVVELFIPNQNQNSAAYQKLQDVLRPGHGITMQMLRDPNVEQAGGGAASARLTAGYVAAGEVAQQIMDRTYRTETTAELIQMGRCEDPTLFVEYAEWLAERGDSVGGVVRCTTIGFPGGIGERPGPSLDAKLAEAMLTINGVKGFFVGDPLAATRIGSLYTDEISGFDGHDLQTRTNNVGGILGGISTSGPIVVEVHFKPTSSIRFPMRTVDLKHNPRVVELGPEDRHDPCVAIRGVPVVRAMQQIVLCQALLGPRTG